MKNKKDIEIQISELNQNQKDTILKIGKYYILIFLAVFLPAFAYVIWNFLRIIQVEKYGDVAHLLMRNNIIALSGVLVYFVASLIFVRVKFPFYSDKKYKFLRKNKSSLSDEESVDCDKNEA